MVLILTKNNDGSSNGIIDWLTYYKKKFIRVNGNDDYTRIVEITSDKIIIEQQGKQYDLLACDSVWYRRNSFSAQSFGIKIKNSIVENVIAGDRDYAKKQLLAESNVLTEYLYYLIEQKIEKRFGGYFSSNVNKLIILEKAKSFGLKITDNFIISDRKKLEEKISSNGNLITKSFDNGVYALKKEYGYFSYTERVNTEEAAKFSSTFFPSLLQKEIRKNYELRVFYLAGKFYSTVIFSQKNESTSVDSRKHSKELPRHLPYQLPNEIEDKLQLLMTELHLKMGSIDMIVDREGNYIFLEVNPVGQFTFYSNKCNYFLERELARLL